MVDPAFDFDLPENLGDRFQWGPISNAALSNIPVGYGVVDGNLVIRLKNGTEASFGPLPVAPGGDDAGIAGYVNTPGSQSQTAVDSRVTTAVDALVEGAPGALDTLNELAAALGDDPNFATTVTTALANRIRYDAAQSLTAPQQIQARTNLGAASAAQGAKADTAVQPGSLAAVATSGQYVDLTGRPTLGTAAAQNTTAFAPASHTHPISDVVNLTSTIGGLDTRVTTLEAETGGGGGGGIDTADVGYDIVIVVGQSNAAGAGTPVLNDVYDMPHDRLRQYAGKGTYAGTIIRAIDPLSGAPQDPSGGVGPAVAFGREWARRTPENRSLLIVPVAVGGVPLVNGPWAVGALYYQQAIANATTALAAAGANARVVAFLWVQGEGDAVANVTQTTYTNALNAVIAGWRAAIPGASEAKFIIGSMVPEWYQAPNGTSVAINAAHVAVANADPNAVYVPGPTGMNQDTGGIHYSAAGQRELGRRMCLALYGGVPDTVTNLVTDPRSASVVLSWSAAIGFPAVTSYVVEQRPATGGAWTQVATPTGTTATVSSLTNGTEYEFRIAAVNTSGVGPWSAPNRETPSAYAGAVATDAPLIYIRGDDPMPADRKRLVTPVVGLGIGSGLGIGDGPRAIDGSGASTSRMRLGSPAGLTNVSAFTVEMLVRFDALGDRFLAVRDDAGSTRDWRFAMAADNIIEFYKFTGTLVQVRASAPLSANTTYHLAVTYGAGTIRIYVNGSQVGSGSASGSLGGTQEIAIGGRSGATDGTFGVDGRMAGIALYNKALTAARIAAHATAAGL